jgi:hypothetical protein
MSYASNYPPGMSNEDYAYVNGDHMTDDPIDECALCGKEIDTDEEPSVDLSGEIFHASCAAEVWMEELTDEELEAYRG